MDTQSRNPNPGSLENVIPAKIIGACPWCIEEGSVKPPARDYTTRMCLRHYWIEMENIRRRHGRMPI